VVHRLIGPEQGLAMAQESINTLKQYDRDISVNTLDSVNINAIFLNQNEIVLRTSQEMLARADRSGDVWERAWALIWSGYAFVLQGQIAEALQAGQEALAIFERLENPFGSSVASGIILGTISMAIGDLGAAKAHFLRGMQAAEEINYLRLLHMTNDYRARLRCWRGCGASAAVLPQEPPHHSRMRQTWEMLAPCVTSLLYPLLGAIGAGSAISGNCVKTILPATRTRSIARTLA
jgi:hypothetical protein